MNLILKNYEKQDATNTARTEKQGERSNKDNVTISPKAGKRFFRDIMENSLQKGLNEVVIDEN
jgi:hypothetical protein